MAMRILGALHRFAEVGEGDIRKLQGEIGDLPLGVGDDRVRFTEETDNIRLIQSVRHRREAYR